jgi:ribosome-associated toxin RatA of RatAB toxin-antitoxin module
MTLRPLIALLACSAAAPVAGSDLDPAGLQERLIHGDVVAREIDGEPDAGAARMQVLVRAPARAVWAVILSCEQAFTFVDGLRHCEVLEESPGRALVRQVVEPGWPVPTYDVVFESLRQPYGRIDFALVEGNLEAMKGSWIFEETPQGTVVDYQVEIRPELPIPRFIVRRNLREGMPDLLSCVRGLAGGSLSTESAEQDLADCPGPRPAKPPGP